MSDDPTVIDGKIHKLEGNVIHNCNLLELLLELSATNLPR